ncbi:hypothetical protein Trydic_g1691 [Trypoxylus dichotomus]
MGAFPFVSFLDGQGRVSRLIRSRRPYTRARVAILSPAPAYLSSRPDMAKRQIRRCTASAEDEDDECQFCACLESKSVEKTFCTADDGISKSIRWI